MGKKWAARTKRYLNNEEKTELAIVACMKVFMDGLVDKFTNLSRSTELIKNTKMARTYADKVMKTILEPLNADEQKLIIGQVAKLEIVTRTRQEVMVDMNKRKEINSKDFLPKEDVQTLCSFAVTECMECTMCEYHKCRLRKILMEHDIEPMDANAEPEQCQYQYSKLDSNAMFNLFKDIHGVYYRVEIGLRPQHMTMLMVAPLPQRYWKAPKITSR